METPDVPTVVKSSIMNNGKMIFGIVLIVILSISFLIWTMYKRMKRLESQSKESQKINNEVTNIKYALQETMNNVDGLRRRVVPSKPKAVVPVPVPSQRIHKEAEIPAPKKLTVEEVDEDEVEGESEVIEVEEDSDFEEESEDSE